MQPRSQQRRGFHVGWKHPAGPADESFNAETMHPGAQGFRPESGQQRFNLGLTPAVTRQERRRRFRMGQIHSTLAGQQELAPDRWHGIVEIDLRAALAQYFGGHQAGRAAADDGDTKREFFWNQSGIGGREGREIIPRIAPELSRS